MKLLIALLSLSLSAQAQLPPEESELKVPDGSVYRGKLKDGRPDGIGFIRFANGNQYEGQFKDGASQGHGVATSVLGDKYEGQWKNSQRNGVGKQSFRIGGSYEGGWKDDRYHGKGVITYLGSGRRHETHFDDGVEEGSAANVAAQQRIVNYRLKEDADDKNSPLLIQSATYPQDKKYGDMSDDEKASLRARYGILLAKSDEPPFPIDGMRPIATLIHAYVKLVSTVGKLGMIVHVLPDGAVDSVSTLSSPDVRLTKYAETMFKQQKFKPALCSGTPCAMPFIYGIDISARVY
jgi:hypothetical protein